MKNSLYARRCMCLFLCLISADRPPYGHIVLLERRQKFGLWLHCDGAATTTISRPQACYSCRPMVNAAKTISHENDCNYKGRNNIRSGGEQNFMNNCGGVSRFPERLYRQTCPLENICPIQMSSWVVPNTTYPTFGVRASKH